MKSIATEFKYGLIYTLAAFCWVIIEFTSGLHTTHKELHNSLTWIFFIPALAIYYFALRAKRRQLGGIITFKQAFLSGLLVMCFSLVLSPVIMPLYFNVINPHFFSDFRAFTIGKGMRPSDVTEYFTLKNYILQGTIGNLVLGIIFSAFFALLIKRTSK